MNKTELVEKVAEETKVSKTEVNYVIETALKTIVSEIAEGNKVSISGFGTLEKYERKAKNGFNPHTLQPMKVPASMSVRFKPSEYLKGIL